MSNLEIRLSTAKKKLESAEYILIGAGAGFSAAAGITYSGKHFTDNFKDYIDQYGFTDLYSSSFYPFETDEEFWAYWAKHISIIRFDIPAMPLYKELLRLVENENYFVLTTNVEYQFNKAGFDNNRIFMVQGDYGFLQCAKACHKKLYYNEETVAKMIAQTMNLKIPTQLIPRCPVCGGKMSVNIRTNSFFVEDDVWDEKQNLYTTFLDHSKNKKVVYLELGVGFNTPSIIRYPFEKLTYQNENATLIRMNRDFANSVEENKSKTISFSEDTNTVINTLLV